MERLSPGSGPSKGADTGIPSSEFLSHSDADSGFIGAGVAQDVKKKRLAQTAAVLRTTLEVSTD
nr:hypothetical protein CE91St29_14440 [Corynebacterium striatum]